MHFRLLIFLFLIQIISGNRRKRISRVGFRPDPHLRPFTNTSNLYISYTNFIRGFISSQGLFNRTAPVPSNATYASFMDTVVGDGRIEDRNELSVFMAHVLVASKGLTQTKENNTSVKDDFAVTYYRRGYLGIKGVEMYRDASLALFKDFRLLEAPELVLQTETINWKVALWNWNRVKMIDKSSKCIRIISESVFGPKSNLCAVIQSVYTILKREWDPKSESFKGCKELETEDE